MSTKKDKLNSVPGSLAEMPTAPISDPVVIYLQHKYPAKYTSGWATLPWPAAHSPYLRFYCCLSCLYNTEVEVHQSLKVGFSESNAALIAKTIVACLQQSILSHSLKGAYYFPILSFWTYLRIMRRSAAVIYKSTVFTNMY